MKDSKLLHFLKHFPAWMVLSGLLLIVLWVYLATDRPFFERLIDTIIGGLLTILTGRATQPQAVIPTKEENNVSFDLNNLTPTEIDGAVENLQEK